MENTCNHFLVIYINSLQFESRSSQNYSLKPFWIIKAGFSRVCKFKNSKKLIQIRICSFPHKMLLNGTVQSYFHIPKNNRCAASLVIVDTLSLICTLGSSVSRNCIGNIGDQCPGKQGQGLSSIKQYS